jgi:23S rRNA (cytosine1962-C5)-methyltransferase
VIDLTRLASPTNSLYFDDAMKSQLVLRKHEEHRIVNGHQWVFSNEIKTINGSPEAGDVVELLRYDGKFLGVGFYNPHSLIAFRLLSRERVTPTFDFFEQRISQALDLRQRIYPESESYRVVHGEADFLPGLVIDKYNEFLSLQTFSVGMEKRLTLMSDVLESLFHPMAIVERNESPLRALEHLPQKKGVVRGTLGQTIINEHGLKFKVDLLNGQKTGFFLDQRENRFALRRYVRDASVLDCFCNEGGFALNAAVGGAKDVTAIDISESAVNNARVNTTINNIKNVTFEVADVFEKLKALEEAKVRFDAIVLDPPSFSKNKKTVATAIKGYKEINSRALRILNPGGFLITASCSHHITAETFLETIESSARSIHRSLQLLKFSGASLDHPSLVPMPETSYLKFAIYAVT